MAQMDEVGGLDALDPSKADVRPTEDGGAVVDFNGPLPETKPSQAFDENIADMMTEHELSEMASDIIQMVDDDDRGREDWKKTYAKGLKLLGLNYEERTDPWAGACGAFHPLLLESIIRFNAQAMSDLFPGAGPVKTKITGKQTEALLKQSQRIHRDMNYMATNTVKGFREETDMMMFNLPLAGTTFRSWRFDAKHKRPAADYILPEHVIIPYAAASLHASERYTVVLNKTKHWIKQKQKSGFYRDVEIGNASVTVDTVAKARDKIKGQHESAALVDHMHKMYECHILYEVEADARAGGEPAPYVITVDTNSTKVLSVRREWRETDEAKERVENVVQHKYMPGFGPYGLGLINILGGLTESATGILRQLVDAGTLSNLPAGYKAKGLRITGDSDPIAPGEWRDVDVPAGALRENFFPLPYKEPSTVLSALLGQIVDEGRRIGSVADMKITDMTGQNMPVGTTLAIIERSMKVMSAVSMRLYESFGNELQVFKGIIKDFMSDMPYAFELDKSEQGASRKQDYNDVVSVIPVADPNATTMAQRIMIQQAVVTLTQSAPQIYDLKEVHRDMITVLGSEEADRYVPRPVEVQPRDPVTENMDLLNLKPVKAGMGQNHDAHIKVHMDAVNDPKIADMLKSNPAAGGIMAAAAAHLQEHIAFQYREALEQQLGVPLPEPGQPLPPDVEYELAGLVADAADKLLGKRKAEQKAAEILAAMEDPVIQNEQRALDIKEKEADARAEVSKGQLELANKKLLSDVALKLKTQQNDMQVRQAEMLSRHAGVILQGNLKLKQLEIAQQSERDAAYAELERVRVTAASDRYSAVKKAELARNVAIAEQALKDREAANKAAIAKAKEENDLVIRGIDEEIKIIELEIERIKLAEAGISAQQARYGATVN